MELSLDDRRLIDALHEGLPLVARPYAALGERLGLPEDDVMARLTRLQNRGVIRRFGAIVRHRELGYTANAMVVWDVADDKVAAVAARMTALPFVTLCYRRERRPPHWRYNLFCMIHGREREAVQAQIRALIGQCALQDIAHEVLFSRRAFKQTAARFITHKPSSAEPGPEERRGERTPA